MSETISEPGLLERFSAFLSGKANQQLESDLATVRQSLLTLGDQKTALEVQLKERNDKITQLEADLKASLAAQTNFEVKLREEAAKLGELKSREILTSLNVQPLNIKPDGAQSNSDNKGEELIAKLDAMRTDRSRAVECTEFYREHKKAIDAAYRARKSPSTN